LPHPGGLKLPATSPAGQAPAHRPPLVEVLTTPGCPHRDAAIALVQQACAELACNAEIQVIDICDQQAAEQTRFLGSPTIRVDGRDIDPGAEQCVENFHRRRLDRGEHSLRGLPEAHWVREALRSAQARRYDLEVAGLADEVAAFLAQVPVAEGLGAKLNRLLFGFLEAEILPQARRAAELGIDPTPLLEVVAAVLQIYGDALKRPHGGTS
jgi:hypothetical protein